MKTASLSGSLRESVGKKDAATLRKNDRIPGVLYGGDTQTHFHVARLDLDRIVFNPEVYRIQFELDGKTTECIIQDVQFHPVTDKVVHIDFLEVMADKPIRVELPLRTRGTSPGVMNGGRLELSFRRVPVRGLATKLPDSVYVDISKMEIGDNARVRDIEVEGFELLMNDSVLIASIKRTRAAMSAAAARD
jgi:large subunit ribosomal protein L25